MLKVKLYLDDIRTPKDSSFIVVRSYDEAISYVEENGMPDYISFDHDLGVDDEGVLLKSGFDFAKWLSEADMDNLIDIPQSFEFNVHSANPEGVKNIEGLLNHYLRQKHYKELDNE
jgi:hypothetical protein